MNQHKDLVIRALVNMRGDDLARARRAFAGLSNFEMSQEYGSSGKTKAEILAEYEEYNEQISAALTWVESLLWKPVDDETPQGVWILVANSLGIFSEVARLLTLGGPKQWWTVSGCCYHYTAFDLWMEVPKPNENK